MADGKKTYYQVSFTGGQALAAVIVVILALGLAFFFGARAGFERGGESEPAAVSREPAPPAAPAASTETASTSPRTAAAATSAAAPSASPSPGATEETPVFEDREAGVGETPKNSVGETPKNSVGETPKNASAAAPSRTEIAGSSHSAAAPPPTKVASTTTNPATPKVESETSPRKASSPARGYWVQVISTSSKAEASRWKEKLAAKSYRTAAVTAVDSTKGKLYRVRTGPYPDRAQARKAAEKISAQFKQKAWVASE